jgi:hypothetical protein
MPALPAFAVIFAIGEMAGGVVSWTVTLKSPVSVFPAESVVEQDTSVVPRAKDEPEGGTQVTGREPSTRSEADAENVTTAPVGPVASSVRLPGRFRVGAEVSATVMVKLPLAKLPSESTAEQVTAEVPSANTDPDAGVHVTETTPSTVSLAEAENVTIAPAELVASSVIFAGSVSVGAVVSAIVTVKPPLAVLPPESDAEQLTAVIPSANVAPDAGLQETETEPSTRSFAVAV